MRVRQWINWLNWVIWICIIIVRRRIFWAKLWILSWFWWIDLRKFKRIDCIILLVLILRFNWARILWIWAICLIIRWKLLWILWILNWKITKFYRFWICWILLTNIREINSIWRTNRWFHGKKRKNTKKASKILWGRYWKMKIFYGNKKNKLGNSKKDL